MKASKLYVPDLFRSKKVVMLTPSFDWHGDKKFVGKHQKAVLIEGDYYDAEGAKFVMGDGHWELVE